MPGGDEPGWRWITVLSVALGFLAPASVGVLLVWDAWPALFPQRAHLLLGAAPLALIALAYLACQARRVAPWLGWVRAMVVVLAFLLWAGNQLMADLPQAGLLNDLAITLFVLDVLMTMAGGVMSEE